MTDPIPTKDRLAAALREIGLDDIADDAAEGHYDDVLSPLAFPTIALVGALQAANTPEATALVRRVVNGEFDAEGEEYLTFGDGPSESHE